MQVYENSDRFSLKVLFLFIGVLILAFFPVSSFLFFLKNDAFNGYFPPKFFMSESIHAGYLPLWNPYINFGFPQYGDMSGGYWSPATWLVASTVGYNAYTLTIELLLYILIGGTGVYKLSGLWIINKNVRIIAGIAFMCCGYNIGHLQHFNWVSGAAFLPWCLWSYFLVLKNNTFKNIIRTVLLFYLLISSAHPGIIIGTFYFFSALLLFTFFINENKEAVCKRLKKLCSVHALILLLLLLLSAGMICGYLDIIPHFIRGEKISLKNSLSHPTTMQSWTSILFPFSTVKNDAFFNTDISMRNCYFSLILLLFFFLACFQKKNNLQKFLFFTGVLFVLLSSGGVFKTLAYKFIPLIGYVRLNGEFRIFALLCFIIIAAMELEKFIGTKKTFTGKIKWVYHCIEILITCAIIFGAYKTFISKESFIFNIKNITVQNGLSAKLKATIDSISFYDTLWIQGFIQLLLLWGLKYCIKFDKWNLLRKLVITDLIISSLLNIPFTGVGKTPVAQVQSVLNKSPRGIPIPILQPIKNNDTLTTEGKRLVGDWSMYNKQIGVVNKVNYPILLKNAEEYFSTTLTNKTLSQSFIHLDPINDSNNITIHSYSPNKITLTCFTKNNAELILQQNFYPHWFYINKGIKKNVQKAGINFMSVPVTTGSNEITLSFEPVLIRWMMLLSAVSLLVYCTIIFYTKKTLKHFSQP